MRRTFSIAAVVGALCLVVTAAQGPPAPRVVMISIDGLMPVSYTTAEPPAPQLRQLAADGVSASGVVGVMPTVTFPSHTTLITGVEPAVHGIVDNLILDPENRGGGAWNWYARSIKAPTLPIGGARERHEERPRSPGR